MPRIMNTENMMINIHPNSIPRSATLQYIFASFFSEGYQVMAREESNRASLVS
jgi:hypothetical protein